MTDYHDPKGWTKIKTPLSGPWAPASGYMTRNGKALWRVWYANGSGYQNEKRHESGKPWLFKTYDAAWKAAESLNTQDESPPT
jgi:hypothetical protein